MVLSSQWQKTRLELDLLRRSLPPTGSKEIELWRRYQADPCLWIEECGLFQDKNGVPIKLDSKQKEILRLEDRKTIVNCHRQFGKSTLASLLCFHKGFFYPRSLCLLFAPSIRQSSENFRKISDALNLLEPRPILEEDTKLTLKFSNGSRIISLPGSQRTTRGYSGPDLIIIDEAAQASDDLLEAVIPMLASNLKSRIILTSTPWGSRGFFHAVWTQGGDSWRRVLVTVESSSWISKDFLESEKQSHPEAWMRQEFNCEFLSNVDQVFADELVDSLFSEDVLPLFDNIKPKESVQISEKIALGSDSLINPDLKTLEEGD